MGVLQNTRPPKVSPAKGEGSWKNGSVVKSYYYTVVKTRVWSHLRKAQPRGGQRWHGHRACWLLGRLRKCQLQVQGRPCLKEVVRGGDGEDPVPSSGLHTGAEVHMPANTCAHAHTHK